MSNSLWPHGQQHARPLCPSQTPWVYWNSCSLSRWCHPTISSSVVPFSSCPQSFPASGSFQMSQLFASGGQSTGVSASTSLLPVNIQDWFPLGWTGWILQSKIIYKIMYVYLCVCVCVCVQYACIFMYNIHVQYICICIYICTIMYIYDYTCINSTLAYT